MIPRSADKTPYPELEKVLLVLSDPLFEYVDFALDFLNHPPQKEYDEDILLPPMLLYREFYEGVGAIGTLIRSSYVEPAKSIGRTIFEIGTQLMYLLEDIEVRSLQYIYVEKIEKIQLAKTWLLNTEQNKNLNNRLIGDKYITPGQFGLDGDYEKYIQLSKAVIDQPKFKPIRKAFNKIKGKSLKWYQLNDGPNNCFELAKHLGIPSLYELYYRDFSKTIHGSNEKLHKIRKVDEQHGAILDIRLPNYAPQLSSFSISMSNLVISHYVKGLYGGKEIDQALEFIKMMIKNRMEIQNIKININ